MAQPGPQLVPANPIAHVVQQQLQEVQQLLVQLQAQVVDHRNDLNVQLQNIRQDQQYAEHKNIARAFNSNVHNSNASLFRMHLPNQNYPHPNFPWIKGDIEGLSDSTINILFAAYNIPLIGAGVDLQEKKVLFAQFIGSS